MQRQPPTHATFSADRDLLAIAYRGRPILLFNLESQSFFGNSTAPVSISAKTVGMLGGDREPKLTTLTCHPSGDFVFCGKRTGIVSVYSTKDGKQLCVLYHHATSITVTSIFFGAQTSIIVSADESGRFMIHQLAFTAETWSSLPS